MQSPTTVANAAKYLINQAIDSALPDGAEKSVEAFSVEVYRIITGQAQQGNDLASATFLYLFSQGLGTYIQRSRGDIGIASVATKDGGYVRERVRRAPR